MDALAIQLHPEALLLPKELFEVWQANVDDLGNNDQEAFMTVSDAIDDVRENVILVLETLD